MSVLLHNHTEHSNYRMLDSTNKIPDLISYAKKLGYHSIAITDHETVGGHMDANEFQSDDFKVILGNEIYLCKDDCKESHIFPHFILLAKDAEGHRALRELSTIAWCENSFMWVNLRVPTFYSDLAEVMKKYKGHLIGCTACAGGALGKMILKGLDPTKWLLMMKDMFGEENFYMEMQPSVQEEQRVINEAIVKLSEETGIGYIITTDSHYLKKEDKEIHKSFLQSQEADRETGLFYETTYLMSEDEIRSYLDYLGDEVIDGAFKTSDKIADMIEVYSLEKPLRIPYNPTKVEELDMELFNFYKTKIKNLETFINHDVGPKEGDPNRHLVALAIKNMAKEPEIFNTEKAYREIEFELDSIMKLSENQHTYWSGYILQTRELINVCWDHSLVGCSRGSGAGFVLLYLCEVIQINMLREDVQLYPWRFLNPYRVSPLDVDCDIEGDAKEEIIASMREKFGGYRHVTKVQTLLKAKTKNSIQIACRGLGYSKEIAQFLGSFVKYERGTPWTLSETYENDKQFKDLIDNQYKDVYEVAKYIEGMITGVGQHAGGVVYDNHDLVDSVALMKLNSGDIITQNDLHKSEAASLIKYDLLGVDYLTKIHTCLDLLIKNGLIKEQGSIKDTYMKYMNIYDIDRTSEELWDAIDEQKVLNIFQFEGQAGKQAIKLGQPRNLEDMSALNSVMRLMGDGEPPLEKYARFKNDINQWYHEMNEWGISKEDQKWLEGYCLKNYGFLPNQENFMSILQDEKVGGHDLLYADLVRKAVAKKNPKGFLEKQEEYYNTMKEKNLNENLCKYVWEVLVGASKGYGFNTAHTLAYSIAALQESNLAIHYPGVYWACANLISDSGGKGNPKYDKISKAVAELKNEGFLVHPPYINECEMEFSIDGESIIYGLKPIMGLPSKAAETIMEVRKEGKFTCLKDFIERTKTTKSAMFALIKAGCFDKFGNREDIMTEYVKIISKPKDKLTAKDINALVGCGAVSTKNEAVRIIRFRDFICNSEPVRKEGKGATTWWYKIGKEFKSDVFFETYYLDNMIEDKDYVCMADGYEVKKGAFDKAMKNLIGDFLENKEMLNKLNESKWKELFPEGNRLSWEVSSVGLYYEGHELDVMNDDDYSVTNYFDLPEEPVITKENYRKYNGKIYPRFEISRIAGTVISVDKNKNIFILLTKEGPVQCKMFKGQWVNYTKETDGEENWLKKGTLLFVHGYRTDDMFMCKSYQDSALGRHILNRLNIVNGEVIRETEKGER